MSASDLGLAMPNAACWKKLFDLEIQKVLDLERPIAKANIYNQAVTAATNIIAPDPTKTTPIVPTNGPCLFRVYVVLDTAGVFSVQRIAGGTTTTENLNQGVALTANAAYIFDVLVDQGEKIDFQTSVSGKALKLCVLEKDDVK